MHKIRTMIRFNECRILPNNKALIVDVSIDNLSVFDNVKIANVFLDTQDTYNHHGPDTTREKDPSILLYSQDMTEYDVIKSGKHRHLRLEFPLKGYENNLLYVWVQADEDSFDVEAATAPCEWGRSTVISPVVNTQYLYSTLMNSVRQIEDTCNVPKDFINDFFRLQSIETALQSGHFEMANKYWNMFFKKDVVKHTHFHKPCGCKKNGRT